MTRNGRMLLSTILMSTMATTAWAQGRGGPCTLGYELSYGISAIDCLQCTVRSDGNEHWTEYGAEPVVRAMFRSMTPIQPGDVLVAIDGKLITTAAGARALSHPVAGQVAKFTVRRGGKQIDVNVKPGTPCPIVSAATAAFMAQVAAANAGKAPLTGAARDSAIRASELAQAQLRDSFELRYDRDAFSRPYNVNLNGDTVKLGTIKSGRMQYLPEGRALFITDSAGARQFRALNPVRPSGGLRGDPANARRENARVQWQFGEKPTQTDTLPGGVVRTIWHEGTDTVFTIPNGGKGGTAGASGFQIGRLGFLEPEVLITTQPDGSFRTISNGGRDTTYQVRSAGRSGSGSDSVGTNRIEANTTMTRGWLGLALECVRCSMDRSDPADRDITVRFTAPPRVAAIKPGVAADAGFRPGDVIRSIDGQSMITAAGSDRFANLHPGDHVKFVVDRDGQPITLTLVVPKGI